MTAGGMMQNVREGRQTPQVKRAWARPEVRLVGTVGEVMQTGMGKVTVITGDPGENLKVEVMG
jgi:hypothetical protein